MNLCSKYKPLHISELEFEYPKLVEYLNTNKTFIVNGAKYSGKSTIVKLYLNFLNYDYLLIDDFNLTKESLIEKFKYKTKSVYSYFFNKKYIIVIDNFELFDTSVKDFIIENSKKSQFLIITNKYLNSKVNYVRINTYSIDYILDLYCIIFYIEKGFNCKTLPNIENISQMYSILEFNLSSLINESEAHEECEAAESEALECSKYDDIVLIFNDKFDYKFNDLVKEKNFEKKLYILDKINSYNIFHHNLIYNYKSIDELADCYDNLSESLNFLTNNNTYINSNCLEFYSILSMIGTSYNLNDFRIYKENNQIRKKINLNYS